VPKINDSEIQSLNKEVRRKKKTKKKMNIEPWSPLAPLKAG